MITIENTTVLIKGVPSGTISNNCILVNGFINKNKILDYLKAQNKTITFDWSQENKQTIDGYLNGYVHILFR